MMVAREMRLPDDATDCEQLLHQWLKWWFESDDAPAKMPNALHIKTSIYFAERNVKH